jgi:hypothetical protein
VKHEADEDGRCRATDLLVTDCSGCRGSDESFVNALLKTEHGPWSSDQEPELGPAPDEEGRYPDDRVSGDMTNRGRPMARKWWLDTGPPTDVVADSHAFKSSYNSGPCKSCGRPIMTGQRIVHVNVGGYAHVQCLEAK